MYCVNFDTQFETSPLYLRDYLKHILVVKQENVPCSDTVICHQIINPILDNRIFVLLPIVTLVLSPPPEFLKGRTGDFWSKTDTFYFSAGRVIPSESVQTNAFLRSYVDLMNCPFEREAQSSPELSYYICSKLKISFLKCPILV